MAFQGSSGFQIGAFQRFRKETLDTRLSYDTQASAKLQFAEVGSGLVETFADARCYSPALDAAGAGDRSYLQPINTNQGMSLGFK